MDDDLLMKARDLASHIEGTVWVYEIDDEATGGRKQFLSTRPDLEEDDESIAFDIKLLYWVHSDGWVGGIGEE